jgi:uncharacterized protein YciU (UPF0263 family)
MYIKGSRFNPQHHKKKKKKKKEFLTDPNIYVEIEIGLNNEWDNSLNWKKTRVFRLFF